VLLLSATTATAQDAVTASPIAPVPPGAAEPAPLPPTMPPPVVNAPPVADAAPVVAPSLAVPAPTAPASSVSPRYVSNPQVQALPEPVQAPMAAPDDVQPAPATAAASPRDTRPAAPRPSQTASVVDSAATDVPQPVEPRATPIAAASPYETVLPEGALVPVAEPRAAAVPTPGPDWSAILAGLAGIGVVGGIGYGLTRRRKPSRGTPLRTATTITAPDMASPIAEPLRDAEVAPAPAAQHADGRKLKLTYSAWPDDEVIDVVDADVAAMPDDSFAILGSALAPTGTARRRLVEAIANAGPTPSNPFLTDRARRKRARWMLQRHDYLVTQNRHVPRKQSFDWRTYTPGQMRPAPRTDVVTI